MIPSFSLGKSEGKVLKDEYEIVIIGGGPAGLSAGIYAIRAGLDAVVIEKTLAGGLVAEDPLVENYLGFESIEGEKLSKNFRDHALKYVNIVSNIEALDIRKNEHTFLISFSNGQTVKAKAVIMATGTTHKKLGIKGEEEYLGKGVSYCVTCDAYFFRNKKVAVIGGGNSGAIAALYLKSVNVDTTIVEYMPKYMCEKAYQEQIKKNNIQYIINAQVMEIYGDSDKVKGLKYKDRATGIEHDLQTDGVFIYVGLIPQSQSVRSLGLKMDSRGYIITDKKCRTNIDNFYSAGDVTGDSGQIIISAGQGAVAALSAYEDLRLK
ncbi:MAG: NAD(P)/FAD-dependent oxidoreductase [Thermoplasmata archaeon]